METIFQNSPLPDSIPVLLQKIGIAILIGFLVGLERESKKKEGLRSFAGIRTFPLIAIFGFLAAFTSSLTDTAVYISFFVTFGILVSISYYFSAVKGKIGGTTEITFLLVFILGSLVYWDHILLSAVVAIVLVTFLALKARFREFAGKIDEEDILAILKFGTITLIVLPLLPNETFGPFDSLNPSKIWYFVILIAGISFIGYILFKIIGASRGIQILSLLGGIASSTAVTLSFTQRSKEIENYSRSLAAGIVLASTIMFPRVFLILLVLNKELAFNLLLPISIFTIAGILVSLFLWRNSKTEDNKEIKLTNPFKVMFAIKFGLIFALVLFISSAAQNYFGDHGVYLTSLFAGLADVDAVVLSMTDLLGTSINLNVAVTAILIAFGSNSVVKMIIASMFGSKDLRKYSLIGFSVLIATIIVYALFLFF